MPAILPARKADIILQLNFLEKELKEHHLGDRMQGIFPEGFVFTNALYGLSWCEYGMSDSATSIKARALKEALFAYGQINSEKARSIFDPGLQPEHGIYYTGWNNYLLSKILLLDSNVVNKEAYKQLFSKQCELIAGALRNSGSPFLQSYENNSWPADMCVAMASLGNYDRLFTPKYGGLIAEWISNVKLKLDPNTQLVPHKVNAATGATIIGARGSSISLIIRLLAEIDSNFASEQYKAYRENFVATVLGLPSIQEYPKGQTGSGDIDSGPVIGGVGFAGTIVSIGTFSVAGDSVLADQQYKTIHAFGMSYKTADTKAYLFGQLPVADAFIAWGRSSGLNHENINPPSPFWRFKFHIISVVAITMVWLLYFSRTIFSRLGKRIVIK